MVIICCSAILFLSFYYVEQTNAQFSGDITIDENGTINPSTAPVNRNGDTYTLTQDIQATIYVYRNNTFLERRRPYS